MLFDGIKLIDSSTAVNLTIDNGPSLPTDSNTKGELFFKDGVGLFVYDGNVWVQAGAVVSVNGKSGIVSLTTTDISEGTNKFYTDARARAAISVSGSLSYDASTGVLSYTPAALTSSNVTTALGYTPADASKVGDAVIESDTKAGLPTTGSKGKIYLVIADETDNGKTNQYRWDGSSYVKITSSVSSTDALSEGSNNLFFTESRVLNTKIGTASVQAISIAATDNMTQAFAKLQAQHNALASTALTGLSGIPYDLAGSCIGKPSPNVSIASILIARNLSIPANMTGSIARAAVAPSAQAVFSVKKNNSSVASIVFAANSTTATFTVPAAFTLSAGDILEVVAPASADTTLADVRFTIAATLA